MEQLRAKTDAWAKLGRLLSAAGVAVVIGSLAGNAITGHAGAVITNAQVAGCLAGIGMIVSGIFMSPARRPVSIIAIRWLVAGCIAACSLAVALVAPGSAATWIVLGYVAAICLLLPHRFGALTFVGVLGIQWLATWISDVKADLTGLPLTMLDVRIATANPAGLWDALHLPHWTRHAAIAVACVALLSWVWSGMAAAGRVVVLVFRRDLRREMLGRLLAVPVLGVLLLVHLDHLYATIGTDRTTWKPTGVARLAKRVGILPFLGYSYRIESRATGDIWGSDDGAAPPDRDEVREAVLQYVDFGATGVPPSRALKPNIVVVLAESTFDPGKTFRLEGAWDDELFRRGEQTIAVGPLKVNAIGGGTWITEFETIVGLDSRLFGYSGYYTHASIAPFVHRTIATYLRARGYRTWAFFPHKGDFYNGRRAYENYGFEEIRDRAELTGDERWAGTDVQVVDSVKEVLGTDPPAPLFAYVLLIENHAPHDCGFTDPGRLRVRFADLDEFGPNCALDDYLRRLESTTAAVRSMTRYLEELEARTGRPFVLLTFGDHQPHTFTSTEGFERDYGAKCRKQDIRTTFFHFVSTTRTRLKCCSAAPPATVLPTLLSGFVADGPDEVYLGENLWLLSRCGSDAVGTEFGDHGAGTYSMVGQRMMESDPRSDACTSAYRRALAFYRTAGVVRLTAVAPAER